FFFFQADDGIRAFHVTGVQTCALPISTHPPPRVPMSPSRTEGLFHVPSAPCPARPTTPPRHPDWQTGNGLPLERRPSGARKGNRHRRLHSIEAVHVGLPHTACPAASRVLPTPLPHGARAGIADNWPARPRGPNPRTASGAAP